jgi:hypothetical protein
MLATESPGFNCTDPAGAPPPPAVVVVTGTVVDETGTFVVVVIGEIEVVVAGTVEVVTGTRVVVVAERGGRGLLGPSPYTSENVVAVPSSATTPTNGESP